MDKLPILKIDPEFKDLIRPLRRKEYLQLEENILDEGCRDPIIIWNDYIIDGHNRYSICTKYSIPFNTVSKDFSSREEVIVWICKNQLGRRNITEETRKYLIGRQYESEKSSTAKRTYTVKINTRYNLNKTKPTRIILLIPNPNSLYSDRKTKPHIL